MRRLHAEIEIAATPERVWEVLADFDAYPEWNPFIRRISGAPRQGEKLEVRIEPPGGRGMTFKPTVLEATPDRELRWLGRLLLPGVFDGEHTLRIEPPDEGARSRFIQSEEFRGVLVPLFGGTLGKTEEGFRQMNAALKERAERPRVRSSGPGGEPNV
jgi:hypothetical protein